MGKTKQPTFRQWLKAQLDILQEYEAVGEHHDLEQMEAHRDYILAEARRRALDAHRADVAKLCAGDAAEAIAACLEVLDKPDPDAPLTVQQAAKRLGMSPRRLYDVCTAGMIRCTRNPTRIPIDAIAEYQAKRPLASRHLH